MTHRSFIDREGQRWDAWDVYPLTDRRAVERRQVTERQRLVERRSGADRRHRQFGRSPLIGTDYGAGWLCFESGTERRRHAPVPPDWASWDDRQLEDCCRGAVRVVRRVAS